MLLLPAGATNINIREILPSNNYLAVRNQSGHYYMNGNWRIDVPGPISFAGATWHYDHRPQGFAAPDILTCHGPIAEPVYLALLYQGDRNIGIKYEYSLPENSVHGAQTEVYAWSFKPFSECSQKCGGGTQRREVLCVGQGSLAEVDDNLCDVNTKPAEVKVCGNDACPPSWVVGEYGNCSEPCGQNGTQTRSVQCLQLAANK